MMESAELEKALSYVPSYLEITGPNSEYVVFISNNQKSFAIRREAAELSLTWWQLINSASRDPFNNFYLDDMNTEMLKLAITYLLHESHYMDEDFEFFEAPKGQEKRKPNPGVDRIFTSLLPVFTSFVHTRRATTTITGSHPNWNCSVRYLML
ncbi:hypothetical protein L596_000322 [Steinernema carpocapsae]|uniref:Uncharacterized protein n=1 Tax=Steinernema carpocapsae TaxID=34508 RepID=A0A4U8UHT4_STECR|nr:hypothetical protein L596_000322 [Steinernema carpocapsae]